MLSDQREANGWFLRWPSRVSTNHKAALRAVHVTAGLGALVVRRSVLPLLTHHKAYFGGGTVAVSCAEEDWVVRCRTNVVCS